MEALRRRNITWALATTPGIADQTSDQMALPRLPVGSNTGFALFRVLVSGAFP